MTTPNDHIPRSAVLEAIERCREAHWLSDATKEVLYDLRHWVAALPAAPVDSTPAPQPADFGPCVVCGRSVLDPHWGIVHSGCAAQFRNPQPALDVALTADERAAESSLRETANAIVTPRVFTVLAILDKMRTALTTLAARLAEVERELADYEDQKALVDILQADKLTLQAERDAAITRAVAAEKALADAQATLAGLGEVEWEVQSEHDPYPFEPLKEKDRSDAIRDGLTIRAIRRVLDAGGAGK